MYPRAARLNPELLQLCCSAAAICPAESVESVAYVSPQLHSGLHLELATGFLGANVPPWVAGTMQYLSTYLSIYLPLIYLSCDCGRSWLLVDYVHTGSQLNSSWQFNMFTPIGSSIYRLCNPTCNLAAGDGPC
jgi:hypothetical protein